MKERKRCLSKKEEPGAAEVQVGRKGPPDTASQIKFRQMYRKEDDRESTTSTNSSKINYNPDD